jgi:DNA-binding CsgD family transcriptional regulator/tetratricopeptide (TPR) repeat protein
MLATKSRTCRLVAGKFNPVACQGAWLENARVARGVEVIGESPAGNPHTGSPELLERSEQLAVLDDSLATVLRERQGRLVLLRGEAGVGKTAVVRQFCEGRRPRGRILWGACEPLFTPRTPGPFVDLAQLVGGELEDLLERGGRPHEVLSALAREASPVSPTVLMLEDLHWADEATLDVLRLLEVLAAGTKEIPSTVRDAVLAGAARLSPAARTLLETLAVASPTATVGVLEAIAGDAVECLEECIGAGLVDTATGGVAFRHELARLVIDESMAPNRRVALHARALQAMGDSADPARRAHHAEGAGNARAVMRFAPEAARRASALGAHRESAAQYARALRFAEGLAPEARAELLERRAYECMLTDQTDKAVKALRDALALRDELGDVRGKAEGLQLLSNVLWCPGLVAEANHAAREAVTLLEELDPGRELAMAYGRLSQLCNDAEDVAGAVSWGTRALDLAEALDETQIAIHALNTIGTARFMGGSPEGREQLERSLALARDVGLEEHVGRAMIHLVGVARRQRDYALAYAYLEPALQYTSERGLELWRGYLLGYRAQMELDPGRWPEAVDTAALVLREPRRSRIPQIVALTVVGRVRARRGDPDVWSPLDEALTLAERGEELQASGPVAVARAEAAWLSGDRAGVDRATAAALALARLRRSRSLVAELAAWRRRAGSIDQLEDRETAGPYALETAADWSGAAAEWQELGCRYEAALALGSAGDETNLRRALDELQALGAPPAAAIVARRLRERGVRGLPRGARAKTRANPAGLTARELEVLALVADGLRNAEIAQRLVVSAKTVDHHVSAILRKLDARTRGEAGAKAARLGLVATT